jgi:hypothetical protein
MAGPILPRCHDPWPCRDAGLGWHRGAATDTPFEDQPLKGNQVIWAMFVEDRFDPSIARCVASTSERPLDSQDARIDP